MNCFSRSLMLLMMVSMPGAYAEAFKNEPADFRGIEWGSAYAEHADGMNLVRRDADVLAPIQ